MPSTPARARSRCVYREPVWRIPYFIGGLVNFKRILYIRAQEEMFRGWGARRALPRLNHAIAKPLIWANWRGLESLLKIQLKLKKCGMVPEQRIEDGVNCSVPIATPDFFPMVADGRIKAIRGTFDHYDGKTIVMTGGERVEADIAVLAIGFKLGVPFLPRGLSQQARRGRRAIPAVPRHRQSRSARHGFRRLQFQLLHGALRRDGGNWLVRYADGQLAKQPTAAEMHEEYGHDAALQRVERPAAGVYGGLCVAPYHFKHFDELLDDMGAKYAGVIRWPRNSRRPMPTPMGVSWPRPRNTGSSQPEGLHWMID